MSELTNTVGKKLIGTLKRLCPAELFIVQYTSHIYSPWHFSILPLPTFPFGQGVPKVRESGLINYLQFKVNKQEATQRNRFTILDTSAPGLVMVVDNLFA